MEQPQQVKSALDMMRRDGVRDTLKTVHEKLNRLNPLGYSLCGIVEAVGSGVTEFQKGDVVAAAGTSKANHAEFVEVPTNLVVRVPEGVSGRDASTVAIGAIALHAVRRADLGIGESCVVVGCGPIGLLAIQMLRSSGVRTIAIDIDSERLDLARSAGAELTLLAGDRHVDRIMSFTGTGADAALFTASTGKSEPLNDCFRMVRRRGRVILVGTADLHIDRALMYENEIDFLISTSYGPGRYDSDFEERNMAYPIGYVRWTERGNLAEYLRLVSVGSVHLEGLITREAALEDAADAFDQIASSATMLIVLTYAHEARVPKLQRVLSSKRGSIGLALVGAGSFARSVHLRNLKGNKSFELRAIVSKKGLEAKDAADTYGGKIALYEDFEDVLTAGIDAVMITTRHDTHAALVMKALRANKHVFVEKPLATTTDELDSIESALSSSKSVLCVGFNRRFSSYTKRLKQELHARTNPIIMQYRMNAGFIPSDHWVHDDGGRLIGEACHILDLFCALADSYIVSVSVDHAASGSRFLSSDNAVISVKLADGSLGTVLYTSQGSTDLPKERLEVHCESWSAVLDNFDSIRGYGRKLNLTGFDKGYTQELEAFAEGIRTGTHPIPIDQLMSVARALTASLGR